ncbi:phycobilisome linker polypeptide [Tychonema sp. LEGE 07203]|uniref:phycobilisome linker polypeptide n=1 Tax=Tychonema sp. LEGE 07203 TaxID=1828671 RepID=UPI00187E1991|nr:phycobilisome linker polypeptide [Tychonema sp. LEGE 07203]MBE9093501.1 phycobilisome linker polypeptide [Tychonema sp. LEGE 07203]
MFGQIVAGKSGNTASAGRCFRYEVVGLRQSDDTENIDYSIRSSGSTFITVPYNRMNQEMQRITRMGGKIVNIQPLSAIAESSAESSPESSKDDN